MRGEGISHEGLMGRYIIPFYFHLHGSLFLLPTDVLVVPICAQFTALGLVNYGANIGPKFGPYLLQLAVLPLAEVPLIPLTNTLHLLPCTILHKIHLPPPPPSPRA